MDIALDSTGDIEVVNGETRLVEGLEAIQQHLTIRLRLFRGEWFLNLEVGVPYFESVLKKNPDPVELDDVFKVAILQTPGVEILFEFSVDFQPGLRKLRIDFAADTTEGIINFTEELP